MIKYRAQIAEIKKVEIEKETDTQVVLLETTYLGKPVIEAKKNDWRGYFDTFSEAMDFLIKIANDQINHFETELLAAKRRVYSAKSALGQIKYLTEPK